MSSPSVPRKIWALLSHAQRRTAAGLLVLMAIGMVLETLGIGLVIPAFAVMTQDDLGARYPVLQPWLNRLGNPTHQQLVIGGMLLLVGIYAVKAAFFAFSGWRQATFVYAFQSDMSQRLFAGYLRQPWTFHLQRNSAQLLQSTLGQTSAITAVVQQGLMVISDGLMLFGISALLVAAEPLGAILVVMTLGVAGWTFNRFTQGYILRWGQASQVHERLRIQHLQQGLGGAKEVKLLGREEDFLAQYRVHNLGSATIGRRYTTVTALPRLWLELLAVSGLAGLVFVMIARGRPLDAVLPTIGLFAAAAFRLLPSVGRVLSAVQTVRYSSPVIDTLTSELRLLEATPLPAPGLPMTFDRGLVLDRISFRYPSTEAHALQDVSLSIPRGAAVGFIGGSGAGKSTLVDVILGILPPESGAVLVDGIDVQTNLRGWQDLIGYVPQSIFLTDDTLRRNVAFGLAEEHIDEVAVRRAIQAAQLDEFVRALPAGLETMVGERGVRLSGGQRQRIGIARALYHDPPVLVLDEATSSLDTPTETDVMDAVRALKGDKTLLIVAHRLKTVEQCERLFRFEHGRLVEEGETSVVLRKDATR